MYRNSYRGSHVVGMPIAACLAAALFWALPQSSAQAAAGQPRGSPDRDVPQAQVQALDTKPDGGIAGDDPLAGGDVPAGGCFAGNCFNGVTINGDFQQNCLDSLFIGFAFPVYPGGQPISAIHLTIAPSSGGGFGDVYLMGDAGGPNTYDVRFSGCNALHGQFGEVTIPVDNVPSTPVMWVVVVLRNGKALGVYADANQQAPGQAYVNLSGASDPYAWEDLFPYGFGYCYCVSVSTSAPAGKCPQNSVPGKLAFTTSKGCSLAEARKNMHDKLKAQCKKIREDAGIPCAGDCDPKANDCVLYVGSDADKRMRCFPASGIKACKAEDDPHICFIEKLHALCVCACFD